MRAGNRFRISIRRAVNAKMGEERYAKESGAIYKGCDDGNEFRELIARMFKRLVVQISRWRWGSQKAQKTSRAALLLRLATSHSSILALPLRLVG